MAVVAVREAVGARRVLMWVRFVVLWQRCDDPLVQKCCEGARFEVVCCRICCGDSRGGIAEIVGSDGEIWRLLSDVGSKARECLLDDLRMRGEVGRHRSTHSDIGCYGRSQVAAFVYL